MKKVVENTKFFQKMKNHIFGN